MEGLLVIGDPDPYWGSSLDVFSDPQQPEPGRTSNPAPNLTFATLPLSFMGMDIQTTTQSDYNPAFDLVDVAERYPEDRHRQRNTHQLGLVSAGPTIMSPPTGKAPRTWMP